MKLDLKYIILYTIGCLILYYAVIMLGTYTCKEGLTNSRSNTSDLESYSRMVIPYPENATINYSDVNSPLYSHTVNLPLNDTISCANFCGPKSQCAITRQQCTSDVDCGGCNPGPIKRPKCLTKDVPAYDENIFGFNYNPMATGYNGYNTNFSEIYEGSKYAQIKKPYEGINTWRDSLNKGLELYNKKREINDQYNSTLDFGYQSKQKYYEPKYPMSISATGTFYETTPPAFNADLNA